MESNKEKKELCYTVEEAVEAAGFGRFQLRLCVICGILTAADAMEMLLLSILGPALRCQWYLKSNEVALITTVVFIGFLLGAPLWGYAADRYGRWPIFFIVLAMIAYFGFLTCISPNYVWIIILRFIVGFAIGGGNSSFTLLSEFLPVRHRAKVLIGYQVFWAIGSTFEVGLAYLILPKYGWRWLVFASAIPITLFLFLLKFLPESPRFLVTAGHTEKAEAIIVQMFKSNKETPLSGYLASPIVPHSQRGSAQEMFSKQYLVTTLMLPTIWFGAAFLYYGIVLLSAEIFRFRHYCFGDWGQTPDFHGNFTFNLIPDMHLDPSCCKELTDDDYVAMIVSSVGEFLNIPLMIMVIDVFGRKVTMGIWQGTSGLMFLLLYICMPKQALTGLLFFVRAISAGLLSIAYVYTTEVYPTTIRSTAVGLFSSIARLGAMSTPYVAQMMMPEVSQIGALSFYASVGVLCAILAFLLPIETCGRELPNIIIEVPDGKKKVAN